MWPDNESALDLLGFEPYAQVIADALRNDELFPLTVGVFGDWGSGKSSFMSLIADAVRGDDNTVIVQFQPWLHKDYDDVKGALMVSILDALESRRSAFDQVEKAVADAAIPLIRKLAKRVDWLRLIGFLTKLGVSAALTHSGNPAGPFGFIGALGDAGKLKTEETPDLIKPDDGSSVDIATEPIERSISEIRSQFAKLISSLKIEKLVVFVDDIDRCLPPTIVDVLEAIRLFFAVERTAFVVGADERIIRHALSCSYPEAPELQTDLGREYLEKILQVPVRVPALSASEIEAYIHLLVIQMHVAKDDPALFAEIRKKALEYRGQPEATIQMNYGIAKPFIDGRFPELHKDLAVVGEVAPVLGRLLGGTPREVKRFLNALYLRRRLAHNLRLDIRFDVLAKMMVLEYFDEDVFRKLFQLRDSRTGKVPDLDQAERSVAEGIAAPDSLAPFLDRERVRRWIEASPSLKGSALDPYFTLSRDRIGGLSARDQRLPERVQKLLVSLDADGEAAGAVAVDAAIALSDGDFTLFFEALGKSIESTPSDNRINALVEVVGKKPATAPDAATVLSRVAPGAISFTVPGHIRRVAPVGATLSGGVFGPLMEQWIAQNANRRLGIAAKNAMSPKRT